VPKKLARQLTLPAEDSDPLRRTGSELVLLPPSAALGLLPLARQLPFADHGLLDEAAERIRELPSLAADGDEVFLRGTSPAQANWDPPAASAGQE
jgi:hypothetical protein